LAFAELQLAFSYPRDARIPQTLHRYHFIGGEIGQ